MDDIKKILIYRTDRIGDFLISSPFIKNLKLKFPNSKIHIMCSSYNENLIKNFSFIDRHYVFKGGFFKRILMVFYFDTCFPKSVHLQFLIFGLILGWTIMFPFSICYLLASKYFS